MIMKNTGKMITVSLALALVIGLSGYVVASHQTANTHTVVVKKGYNMPYSTNGNNTMYGGDYGTVWLLTPFFNVSTSGQKLVGNWTSSVAVEPLVLQAHQVKNQSAVTSALQNGTMATSGTINQTLSTGYYVVEFATQADTHGKVTFTTPLELV